MLNVISITKKVTMLASAQISQKTSGGLDNLPPMINKKIEEELGQIPCIQYIVIFKDETEALLDLESELNPINLVFAKQLGLKICKSNVRAQKIVGTTLETYGMVVSNFSMSDKDGRERFFKESFLLADIKPDIVLEMLFLTMSNVDVDFQARDLQ